jgi:hypothetical protein
MVNTKNDDLASSFSLPVHRVSKSTASFTAPANIYNVVDKQWLIETSTTAARLGAQRSNVELLCLFTCLNKARELEEKGQDGPKYGNDVWIGNIVQWAANNRVSRVSMLVTFFVIRVSMFLYHVIHLPHDIDFYM